MAKTTNIHDDNDETLTESDAELWRDVTSSVRPLSGSPVTPAPEDDGETFEEMIFQSLGASVQKQGETHSPKDTFFVNKRPKPLSPTSSVPLSPVKASPKKAPPVKAPIKAKLETKTEAKSEAKSGQSVSGLNAATARKFWRGKISIDAEMDLHGYGRIDAQTELTKFVKISHASGKRCLLVITGKGSRHSKPDSPYSGPELRNRLNNGVLRSSFPDWIQTPALQDKILSYCQAPQHLGGAGAWLIYLRKAKA